VRANECPELSRVPSACVFNFVSHGGNEDALRWNCTEVYRLGERGWKIIQTHWSFTRKEAP
jgi:hypothetical protein